MFRGMNGWSWRLGRFFGIDTRVHATFLLLIGWAAFTAIEQGGTLFAAALSVLFLFAVFGSVLLHELGHALTARLYGIETRRITLSPLGGLAQLEGGALSPKAELWVALAGPLTSFALAGLFFTLAAVTGSFSPTSFVGGLGFDLKWDMGWMHDSLRYLERDPLHRAYHHNEITFRALYAFDGKRRFSLPMIDSPTGQAVLGNRRKQDLEKAGRS